MKRAQFQKAIAGVIANTKTNAKIFSMLIDLLYKSECRPTESNRNGIDDRTAEVLAVLNGIGCFECAISCRGNYKGFGYYTGNDAPKGGKGGNFIKINF